MKSQEKVRKFYNFRACFRKKSGNFIILERGFVKTNKIYEL